MDVSEPGAMGDCEAADAEVRSAVLPVHITEGEGTCTSTTAKASRDTRTRTEVMTRHQSDGESGGVMSVGNWD